MQDEGITPFEDDHGRKWLEIARAEDVTEAMLDAVGDCVDGFFGDPDVRMPSDDFLDRFSDDYLLGFTDPVSGASWEIGDYNSPASRKLLRHARAIRREL